MSQNSGIHYTYELIITPDSTSKSTLTKSYFHSESGFSKLVFLIVKSTLVLVFVPDIMVNLPCYLALLAVLLATCSTQAPLGYECFPGYNCYKLYIDKKRWGEADEFCKVEGARLGVINSNQEAFIYSGIFSRSSDEDMFVGIHDLFVEGVWMTMDGKLTVNKRCLLR